MASSDAKKKENGAKQCKKVHCVDIDESFPTSIYLQHLASIQPRTSIAKFAGSSRTDYYRSPRFDPSPAPNARESTGKRVGKLYIMDDTTSNGGPDSASFIESGVQLPAPTRYDKIR